MPLLKICPVHFLVGNPLCHSVITPLRRVSPICRAKTRLRWGRCRASRDGRPPAAEEVPVSDKSPHKTTAKKPGKTIKQKRAEKKAKHAAAADHDFIAHVRDR